jgi:hypothetical protein
VARARTERPFELDDDTLRLSWPLARGRRWHLLARLADTPATAAAPPGECVYRTHEAAVLPPWSVQAWLEQP